MNTTETKILDKLAFGTCLGGIILAAVIAIFGKILNQDFSMIAYGTFVALEVMTLIPGGTFALPIAVFTG